MKKYLMILAVLMTLLMNACKKEGQLIIKPIKAGQPINITGFAIGDTIEQYYDGRKVREFIGRTTYTGRIAFDSDAPVLMELKKKGDPHVLFSKSIALDSVEALKPITFYYDGIKVTERYSYPDAIVGVEQVALYLDLPADMVVDIAYGNASGDVNSLQYFKQGVPARKWVDFMQISPIDGADVYLFLLKSGKKEFLIENDFFKSYLPVNLPTTLGGYQGGGVQSFYILHQLDPEGKPTLIAQDMISLFPR
jgi:hypothetical protein